MCGQRDERHEDSNRDDETVDLYGQLSREADEKFFRALDEEFVKIATMDFGESASKSFLLVPDEESLRWQVQERANAALIMEQEKLEAGNAAELEDNGDWMRGYNRVPKRKRHEDD